MIPCSLVSEYQSSEEEDVRLCTTDGEKPDISQAKHPSLSPVFHKSQKFIAAFTGSQGWSLC
jgi:hypothetical protein